MNYSALEEVAVIPLKDSTVIEHGLPSDADIFRQFLHEVGVDERHLTSWWVLLRG